MEIKIFKKFFITITQPKFVITLIILTLVAALIGALVPQVGHKSPSYFEEWSLESPKTFYIVNLLQLNRVFTSVWFLILISIILLSLGYSIYLQIKGNLKRKQYIPPVEIDWDLIDTIYTAEHSRLIKFMGERGYSLVHDKKMPLQEAETPLPVIASPDLSGRSNLKQTLVFSKNSINRWGGVIFHSGLFLLIVAGIIGLAFQKRGFVQVMEGELLSGMHNDFLVTGLGVFQKKFDVGFKTQLARFNHEYWETDEIKSVSSLVNIMEQDWIIQGKPLTVNSPVRYRGINIYQSLDYGYALSFMLRNPDGKETITHFFLDRPDRRTKPSVGKTDFPLTDYIFDMKFYPDISMNSFYIGRPILYLKVEKGADTVFDGLIIPGDVVNVEGNLLRLFNISQWSGLIYTKSPDVSLAYAGFFINFIGAIIMLFLPYREILISRNGPVLSLYGRTNRYKPLFEEEMEKIKEEISSQFTSVVSAKC